MAEDQGNSFLSLPNVLVQVGTITITYNYTNMIYLPMGRLGELALNNATLWRVMSHDISIGILAKARD
jgi:hypothetical protein